MSQSCAIATIYASEYEIIRQNFEARKEQEARGALYGLWTHSGNVLVQLANAAGDSQAPEWTSLCKHHGLQRVGSWGFKEPKLEDRPTDLDESLGFVYVRRSFDSDQFICYSIPAILTEAASVQETQLTPLPTASPFRAMKDLRATQKLVESRLKYIEETKHWSSKEPYTDFLINFRKRFSETMEVKQFQQPGSDYIAFQMQSPGAKFAIGFPSDFDKKRKVDVYHDRNDPVVVSLTLNVREDFNTLLEHLSISSDKQREDNGLREGQRDQQKINQTDAVKSSHAIGRSRNSKQKH